MKLYEFVDQAISAHMINTDFNGSEEVDDALVDVTDLVQSSSIGDIEVAEEN